MMRRSPVLLIVALTFATLACGPLGNVGDVVSGSEAGTVANLWSDVPAYPGADKVDLELPFFARMAVEAASKAMMSEAGDSTGNLEFIAFSTGESAEEVMAFYTTDRMAAEGWTAGDETGCGVAGAADEQLGGMCVFAKDTDDLASALFIVITPEEGKTSLFYIRIDADPDAMATQAAE